MPLVRGIIDTAAAPLLVDLVVSLTLPTILANPYSGRAALTAHGGGVVPYGLLWQTVTAPPSAGGQARAMQTYEVEFLSLAPIYLTSDGFTCLIDHVLTRDTSGVLWFRGGPPDSVEYSIADGWSVAFHWLVAP